MRGGGGTDEPTIPLFFAVPWLLTWTIILDRWSRCGCHGLCVISQQELADLPEPTRAGRCCPGQTASGCYRNANGNPTAVVVGTKAEVLSAWQATMAILGGPAYKPGPARSRAAPSPHRQRHADWVRAYCPGILDSAGYVPRLGGGLGEIETELGRAVEARGAYIAVSKACAAALADVEALLGELVERKQRLEDLCRWRSS